MDLYADALALFRESDVPWVEVKEQPEEEKVPLRPKPPVIRKREEKRQKRLQQLKDQQPPPPPEKILVKTEAASIGEFRSWSSCTVPLSVVANRESREARDRWPPGDLVLGGYERSPRPQATPAGVPFAPLDRGTVPSTQVF